MPGFFKSIGKIIAYHEPKNKEMGFENLEGENEGNENKPSQDSSSAGSNKKRKERQVKKVSEIKPVPVQVWNKIRNENESDTSEQSSGHLQGESQGSYGNKNSNQSDGQTGNGQGSSPNNQSPGQNQNTSGSNISYKRRKQTNDDNGSKSGQQDQSSNSGELISKDLNVNLEKIKKMFEKPKNNDLEIREFKIGRKIKAFMAYIEGMINEKRVNESVLPELMSRCLADEIGQECPIDYLIENVITIHSIRKENKLQKIGQQVLNGYTALFVDGCSECILIETRGFEKRSINIPQTEAVVKGPQEAFTEDLRTNLTLVRRIIHHEKLVTELLSVGKTTNTKCAVMYIDGLANPAVIQEVKKRINSIDTDFVLGSGMVEQFIEDDTFMLFPQVVSSERPDRTASFLAEGQVVVIVEGGPFSMAVPVTFFGLLHTSEDSFLRWQYGTFLRLIRLFGLFCATLLPGLYVAMIMFHPDVIPTELLISIAQARESVPFPTIVEVLIMELSFELIREGGIRVPSVIGQTLGIVGALILGQAAVSAGLVSPILVIIVSVTALGSFVIPSHSLGLAIRIERFLFIFMGAFLGFFGIAVTFFILAALACSMKSFGTPFLAPVAPRTKINPDVVIKYPAWMQKNRQDSMQSPNRKKQGKNVKAWFTEENNNGKGGDGSQ